MQATQKTLLTRNEQAEALSISWRHLENLRKARLIPFVKLGRSIRYDPRKVAEAIERNLTVEAHR